MRRRIFMTVIVALGAAVLGACSSGNRNREMTAAVDVTQERAEAEEESMDGTGERGHSAETGNLVEEGKNGQTDITLTIGDMVLSGYLYDTEPAKSLLAQLPLTVTLNDSDNDFCGDSIVLDYSANDVTSGYRNGELAFWTPASNFVIFVSGEESSAGTGDLVPLGMLTKPQETLEALEGRIQVVIELAEEDREIGNGEPGDESPDMLNEEMEAGEMRVNITVGDTVLTAVLEDNAATRAWAEQMPVTLPMMDLYGREMCYRYGAGTFPTDDLRSDGYEVGDLAYWPPMGSLVILYKQNGERFERQHLGHIDGGVEMFDGIGDVDVTFELAE